MSITVENLTFSYGMQRVLTDISFSAKPGDFVSVIGQNGVGKSTLFKCMLGLLAPDSGTIMIAGENIADMSAGKMARSVAYIPQSHRPVFNYSVFDMVLMGTCAQLGKISSPGRTQKQIAQQAMEKLGITHLNDRRYRAISGGERQLVLIARAIAQQAKIMIMDEPTASLDFGNRIRVMQTVQKLAGEGFTIIQSTHDPNQAYLYSNKILALHEGMVASYGSPKDTMHSELISKLYGADIEVCSMRDDTVRVCIPASIEK